MRQNCRQKTKLALNHILTPNMDLIVLIGVVGSIASVIGVAMALPTLRSRAIHAAYGLFITALSAGVVYYHQQAAEAKDFEIQAARLLDNTRFENDDRAIMLATLAFLEKHKEKFPETYVAARDLCVSAGLVGTAKADGRLSTMDGSRAVRGLLEGLAGPRIHGD